MKIKFYSSLLMITVLLLSVTGLSAQNIALGKTAVASSLEGSSTPASQINDKHGTAGETNPVDGTCTSGGCTRWSSQYNDNEWVYIDLAAAYSLTQVKIYWESASGKDYKIQTSNDASTWTDAATVTNNSTFINTIPISGTARYVRMLGISRNTLFGYSIWEFEISGTIVIPLGSNLALGKTATASSSQFPGVDESHAVDGQGEASTVDYIGSCSGGCTLWLSNTTDNEWIYVDLGADYYIRQVILYWNFFKANDFKVQISSNAVTWTDIQTVNNNTSYVNTIFANQAFGRYIKMLGISRVSPAAEYALYEMEVYGNLTVLPIKLTDFAARKNNSVVDLPWTASLDRDGDFTVERSANGRDYTAIGTVHEISGSNGQFKNYHLSDLSPIAGTGYYRLKYAETGTIAKYSKVIPVNFNGGLDFTVYPNPVTGKNITVGLTEAYTGQLEIRMFNTTGNAVYHQSLNVVSRNQFEITRTSSIPAGNYLLQVVMENGQKVSKMIIVQ